MGETVSIGALVLFAAFVAFVWWAIGRFVRARRLPWLSVGTSALVLAAAVVAANLGWPIWIVIALLVVSILIFPWVAVF